MILLRIGNHLIKVADIGAVRSYNRRHETDSEGFDDQPDGGPVRAAALLPGLGGTHPLRHHAPDSTTTAPSASMEPLLSWFTGEFSSREQASYDNRFTSAELRLVEIWPGYKGFRWVYAEQFLTERAVRPFRQRIYRFSLVPDGAS